MDGQPKKAGLVKTDYHENSLVYSTHKIENPAGMVQIKSPSPITMEGLFVGVTSLYTRDSSIFGSNISPIR